MNEIKNELTAIFQSILDRKSIDLKLSDSPKNIDGWDSLTHARLITTIEDHFSITFSLRELSQMQSVENIINAISRKQSDSK